MDVRQYTFLMHLPSARMKAREHFLGMPKRGVAFLLANVMFWQPLWAQADGIVVSAPGTTLDHAGNGVQIINIATPNGSGLSHNQFVDYNVNSQGLILNNGASQTSATQLGGIIIGNPNLKNSGSAQIILNEVNGGNPSQLRGYTEVAGQSARVIVANPYGISCNGCGFINTPRVTLTTGKPMLDGAGRLDRFQIDQGSVSIDGDGLDASNVDSFEIITRSARINADIHARKLTVIAGRNNVNATTLNTTARADDGSVKPQFAIDSSVLGGMYAGAIKLVGTEAGVGVKLAGNVAASGGDLQIDVNGHLNLAGATAVGAVNFKAASLENQGTVSAGSTINVLTAGDLTNQHTFVARDSIVMSAGGQLTNSGIIEAGVNADESRNAHGDVSLIAQNINNSGKTVVASRSLTVNATQTLNNQGGTLSTGQSANVSAMTLDNRNNGRVLSSGALSITADQVLNSKGMISSDGNFTGKIGQLSNEGGRLLAQSALSLDLNNGVLSNQLGVINSKDALSISHVRNLDNQNGVIASTSSLNVSGHTLDNRKGKLISNERMTVVAESLNNQGGLVSGWQGLSVAGGTLDNSQEGTLSSLQSNVDIDLSGALINNTKGGVAGKGEVTVTAASLDNRNGIVSSGGAQQITITQGAIDNSAQGLIESSGTLDLIASKLGNASGKISAQKALTFTGIDLDNTSGNMAGKDSITLDLLGILTNTDGVLASGGPLVIKRSEQIDNKGGKLISQQLMSLLTGQLNNDLQGIVEANAQLDLIATRGVSNTDNGLIHSSGAGLNITTDSINNSKGSLQSHDNLILKVQGGNLDNQGGKIIAKNGHLNIDAGNVDNRNGELSSLQDLMQTRLTGVLRNGQGGKIEGNRLDLQALGGIYNEGGRIAANAGDILLDTGAPQLNNIDGGIYATELVSIKGNALDNSAGKISGKTIALELDGDLVNHDGLIESGSNLKLRADSVDNQRGQLRAMGVTGTTDFQIGRRFDNRNGLLETANTHLTLATPSFLNTGGNVTHVGIGDFNIATANVINAGGTMVTRGDMTLDADSWTNSSVIQANNLKVNVSHFAQTASGQLLASEHFEGRGENWTNDGLIASDGTLDVQLLKTYGGNGRMTSLGDMQLDAAAINVGSTGSIAGGNKTTVGDRDELTTLNNSGRLTAANQLIVTAKNVNNYGTLAGGSALKLKASTLLNDQGGLLFSGGDMALRVGSFTNRNSDVYSLGAIDIARDDAGGRSALVENLSGTMESGGDFSIRADSIVNRRDQFKTVSEMYTADIGVRCYDCEQLPANWADLSTHPIASHLVWEQTFKVSLLESESSKAASMNSGRNLDVSGGAFRNSNSSVSAVGKIDIAVSDFENSGTSLGDFTSRKYLNGGQSIEQWQEIVNYNAQNDAEYNQDLRFWNASEADSRVLPKVVQPGVKGEEDNWSQRLGPLLISLNKKDNAVEFGDSQYSTGVRTDAPSFIKNAVFSETIINGVPTGYASAIIQAAGNVTVNAANQINNGVLSPYSSVAAGTSRNADTAASGTGTTTVISLNSQLSPDLAQQQINPLTLPGFSLPTGQNGLFRLNDQSGSVAGAVPNGGINSSLAVTRVRGLPDNSVRSTSHKYLVETNPVLTDLKQFMSSDYLLTNLGYDPDISAKRLGDGFYEQRLIQQAIIERTGQRFIDGQTSDEGLFKYLMNNAIASKDALNLSVGVTLTSQQVAALTHDIVWLEEQQVNGEKVLVPVLYLAQAKNRLAPNGALIQGNDVKLIAGQDLNNAGTLRATNNLAAMAGLNLTNNGGLVEAGNRLDLLATNDVLNTLGGVIAGRDVSVTASNGDVINERTITALDSTLYGILHREFADNAARIEATNDLNVSAGRDINVIGGALQSGRDLSLEATRDVNLASQQVSNSSYQSARHNSSDITQLSAEVSAGRDLSVEAGRDINVIASDVDAKGDIAMAAGENLTISSAADEEHSLSKNKKVTQQEDHVSQVMSAVTAGGDVALSAGNDLAVISSRITAGDEAYLVAGGRLDILAAQDSDYSLYDKKKKGSFGSLETRHDEVTDVNNIGSQISAGGDLTLVSGGDQLYQGAKLNSGKDLTLDSGGKITFEAVKDLHDESHTKSDSDSFWFSAKGEGRTDETLRQSQLTAGGDIVIRAIDGLQIDLKQIDQNTVRQSIEAMVQADPNLAWLEEAERRGDVDWRLVKEIHESFKYDDAGLGPASQLIIAIVASVLIGPLTGAIASNFAVGTVNGGGDLSAGFKAATSIDALKGYATQWATAYGLSTMDSLVGGWQAGGAQVLNGSGVSNPGYSSSLLDWNTAVDNVLRSGSHVLISGGINTAINGGSLKDNLAKALASEGLDFVAAFGNKQVGDLADYLNVDSGSASKILMHALLGGALSVASGGEFKTGALAGAAAEGLTQFTTDALGRFLDERIVTDDQFKVGTAQIIGILAAASGGGDPAIGSWVAGNAERYNQQVHREAKQRLESGFAILHERGEFVDLQPEDVLADLQKIAEGEKDRSQLNPKTVEFLNQFPPAALRDIFFELTDFERYVELGIDISFPTPSPVGKVKAVATISKPAAKEILQALEKKFGAALLEVEAKAARGAKGGSAVADDFFAGTKYTDKVLGQIKTGDLHGFPESVTTFQGAGQVTKITGGDGVVRDMLKIPGEYRGKQGVFEFIKESDGSINHRLFKPTSAE